MRTMGLDLGTKTVGIAVSDPLGITAQGLPTLRRAGLKNDLAELRRLATEYEVVRFILGLPLNMNGTEGPRAEATRRFGASLHTHSGLEVVYQDERLTTVAAERSLLEADVPRDRRKAVIDQVAAQLILQGWLDGQRPPPP